jgi:hypothetical protein
MVLAHESVVFYAPVFIRKEFHGGIKNIIHMHIAPKQVLLSALLPCYNNPFLLCSVQLFELFE